MARQTRGQPIKNKEPIHHAPIPGHPVLSPLALALRLSCAGLALSIAALPAVAEEAARRSFDVPAGNLAEALGSYAQQAAVSLAFTPEALTGLQSSGLHGLYSVDSGFAVLLAGSGYRVERSDNGYRLVAEPQAAVSGDAMELGVTTVAGQGMGRAPRTPARMPRA